MRFAPEHDVPIPYMQRTRDYYLALGFDSPYRWAHYDEVPFTPLAKPLGAVARGADHDRGALSARHGRPGAGREVQRGRQVLHRCTRTRPTPMPDLRISHVGYDRKHTTRRGHRTRGSRSPRLQRGGEGGTDRRAHAALPRRADEPQPAGDDRDATRPSSCARCREDGADVARARPQLTGLPPDRESGRPAPGGERHPDRDHGLRQGHRRALRRAALPLQRLPARQLGRPAVRRRVPGGRRSSWRCACWRRRPPPRTTVQSPLRWSDDAAWKLDYNNLDQAHARGDRRAAQGVRRGEGGHQDQARSGT